MLMNTKNITRDLLLLDLYRKDIIFYFTPSTVYLLAISSSVVLNLILNDKIKIENEEIKVIDESSIRTYNKKMIGYIQKHNIKTLRELASKIFLDNDFCYELYELAVKELQDEGLVKIDVKKQFFFNRNTITLIDEDSVKAAYLKLFKTLYKDDESEELIALALIIDTFFNVDDYFDESEHQKIKEELTKLKEKPMYQNIIVFKEVIDEFYNLIVQRGTNYFGI